MKKLFFLIILALTAGSVFALPTKSEIAKAQPLVAELMADDITAYREKRKTAEQVGDASIELARKAKTEAAKSLLIKGAIQYYVKGRSYDKAAQAVELLQTEIHDMPPSMVVALVQRAARSVTAETAPRLYGLYQVALVKANALEEVEKTQTALKAKSNDAALVRRLGEAQALAGDWKTALETFSRHLGKVGAAAKAELAGRDLLQTADFWWTYESYAGRSGADVFKRHAAILYRKAISAGTVEGLKKELAEKRIKQSGIPAQFDVGNSDGGLAAVDSSRAQDRLELKLEGATSILLIKCPAGTFDMGLRAGSAFFGKHKVTITRPFWMSEAPITFGQYRALMGECRHFCRPRADVVPKDGVKTLVDAMGGDSVAMSGLSGAEVAKFMSKVNERFKAQIPQDHVARLPTDAELAYGFQCGGNVQEPNHAALASGNAAPQYDKIAVDEVKIIDQMVQKTQVKFGLNGKWNEKWLYHKMAPRYKVKSRMPNDWGFYDMAGMGMQVVLDTFQPLPKGVNSWYRSAQENIKEQYVRHAGQQLRDPLMMGGGGNIAVVYGNGESKSCKKLYFCDPNWRTYDGTFRLVIGADLVRERKASDEQGAL